MPIILPGIVKHSDTSSSSSLLLVSHQLRRSFLQMLCWRVSWLQRNINELPLAPVQRPLRPSVMSHMGRDRPKKRVTFSSSSIVFIIASNDLNPSGKTSTTDGVTSEVIQVRPL